MGSSWRGRCCDGCWRQCRYGDFSDFYPKTFKEAHEARWKNTENSEKWQFRDRRRLLGEMSEAKLAAWEAFTTQCPYRGEGIGPLRGENIGPRSHVGPGGLFSSAQLRKTMRRLAGRDRGRHRRVDKIYLVDKPSGTVIRLTAQKDGRAAKYRIVWCTGLDQDQLPSKPDQLPLPLNNHQVLGGVLEGGHLQYDLARPLAKQLNDIWKARRTAPPLCYNEVEDEIPF